MNPLLWIHIAAGLASIPLGTVAVIARKGRKIHLQAGNCFAASMLVLGVTAALLEPYRNPPGSPIGGILICYFVVTSWMAARRREGESGWFEIAACIAALGLGAAMMWGGFTGATTPAGTGPVFAIGTICLIAGVGDLHAVVRKKLAPSQRLARHLWRMCFAFFVATGSFFLGQQDIMPEVMRGSPILFAFAFAPLAVMLFWLIRLRFAKAFARLTFRIPPTTPLATEI